MLRTPPRCRPSRSVRRPTPRRRLRDFRPLLEQTHVSFAASMLRRLAECVREPLKINGIYCDKTRHGKGGTGGVPPCFISVLRGVVAEPDQILFLMREINHRAKNMLSLVQAVARQTAAREPQD